MKYLLLIFFSILSASHCYAQTDTLNRVDTNGKKTGWWRITAELAKLPDYPSGTVVDEGRYENNMKTGVWRHYFANGALQYEMTFKNNRPNGPVKIYHKNGCLSELGSWKNNRWTGDYLLYSEDTCGKVKLAYCFDSVRQGKSFVCSYPYPENNYSPEKTGDEELLKQKGRLHCPVKNCRIIQDKPDFKGEVPTPEIRFDASDSIIISATDGKVTAVTETHGIGKVVIIRNGNYLFVYAGLGTVLVKENDVIRSLGELGSAGKINNKYELVFQVWRNQERENPESWLECTSEKK